jgi:hypothetical protein
MIEAYITEEEICIKRRPAEFSAWVKRKFDEISQKPEGKDAVRFRKGLCKVLVEEVYAMSIWATHLFSEHDPVLLQPVLGNQSYDALIWDLSTLPPVARRLEITQAHEGETTHLRNLMLYRDGSAWGSAQLEKKGTKRTGIEITVKDIPTAYNDYLENAIFLIRDAVRNKAQKNYSSDTDLLVMFEDNHIVRDSPIVDSINALFDEEISKMNLPFRRIYFVGWSKHTFLAREK